MAHTKKSVADRILLKVLLTIIAFICIGAWQLSIPSDYPDYNEPLRIEDTLRNYKSAALMYYTDNDEWPSVGEYLPNSPMVISLDHYTEKSFDKENYSHLLIKEMPAGSKRLFMGLRPGKGSALSFAERTRGKLAKRGKSLHLLQADGLPYSSDILGSGDVFIPMKPSSGKGCL